jgi:sialate O-acetylesterase
MNKYVSVLILFFVSVIATFSAAADVRLPAIIGNHMVLQQNTEVKIWGWCEPGEKIKVNADWDTTTYAAKGTANANFVVIIKTPATGGTHMITVSGNNKIVLEDVLVGEVWLCSGQSNMEMNVNWGLPYQEDVAKATNNSIRFFHIPRTTSDNKQDDVRARWVVCTPETMKSFSAAGYFFGEKLQRDLNVSVGLINASWGGTPAEVWTPKEFVESDAALVSAAKRDPAGSTGWPVLPGLTYNGMIYPIKDFAIAGAIWYQGESNTGNHATYQKLFTGMIGEWRKAWKKDFPFYFVQIAPYAGYGNKNVAPLLREVQTKSTAYPKTGMVVIHDLVNDVNDIHPKMKKEVGQRLANFALADTYGKTGIESKSPVYKSMQVEKDKVRIYFDNVAGGLTSKGGEPTEFYIAGEDQNFVPATAKISDNTVVVQNKEIKKPVAVRFGFSNAAMPNLFGKTSGLPVNLFRTDDWPLDTGAVKK